MKTRFILLFSCLSIALTAQTRYYVSADATGAQTGLNWADAFTNPQPALALAQPGDSIWIAAGIYRPTDGTDRAVSFSIPSGVRVFGGFAGGETELAQRDFVSNPTVLSGDIGIVGDSTDNSYNVMFMDTPGAGTELDGLVVRGGQADNTLYANDTNERLVCGGGLYILVGDNDALPDIRNCRFEHNTAAYIGGGVMLYGAGFGSAAPRFTHCSFEANRSDLNGGGMARIGSSWIDRGPVLEHCDFQLNTAAKRGGGLYYNYGDGSDSLALQHCQFLKNKAGLAGGAAYFTMGRLKKCEVAIKNSVFSANSAGQGAAIDMFTNFDVVRGEILIDSTVFENNLIINQAGSPYIIFQDLVGDSNTVEIISNCIFTGQSVKTSMLLAAIVDGQFYLKNSLFKDNDLHLGIFIQPGELKTATVEQCYFHNNIDAIIGGINFTGVFIFKNCHVSNSTNGLFYFEIGSNSSFICKSSTFSNNKEINYFSNDQVLSNSNANISIQNCLFDTLIGQNINSFFPVYVSSNYYAHAYLSNNFLPGYSCSTINTAITCGSGNIFSGTPGFVNAAAGDYRLLPCSPLVNAGTNDAVLPGGETDLSGQPRIQGGRVDIGAYETSAPNLGVLPEVRPACPDTANGAILLMPENGCPPYQYQWATATGSGQNLDGLAPDLYSITITDQRGSFFTASVSVPQGPALALQTESTPVLCGDTLGGSATAMPLNGNPPFQYHWQGSAGSGPTLSGLPAGVYALTLTDATGCSALGSAEVGRTGNLQIDVEVDEISCAGAADGGLMILPLNGKAPFHWAWENGPHSPAYGPLVPGTYNGTITDALGCYIQWILPLTEPAPLSLSGTAQPASGPLQADGSIQLENAGGGNGPYSFVWSNGQMGLNVNALLPGTYTVTMTDQHDCQLVTIFEVPFTSSLEPVSDASAQYRLFPNPAPAGVCVLSGLGAGALALEFFDANGRVLSQQSWWSEPGKAFERSLNVELPAGAYGWRVRAGGGIVSGKLIIVP
ncbi:MAG: choice-of-anchor Q domain-containing protein [Bacteroidota bacterium]